ncbi:MAG TPA: DUF2141 domain-containing protein [Sphingomicrobium sp.]|nr:DUF2141 domain-containing protein [Sphingomicrobium sp.]
MSKSSVPFVAGSAALLAATGLAVISAPAEATTGCSAGRPSVLVHVAGLKRASGKVKVSLYGADRSRWLTKGGSLSRMKVPVTGKAMDICMPVPGPGRYALAVHHDLNTNGERDRHDGGGYSRNPKVSLLNPKPAYSKAAFNVGNGQARIGVTMLYVRGLGVGPAGI